MFSDTPSPHNTERASSSITNLHAPRTVPVVTAADVTRALHEAYDIKVLDVPHPLESYWDYNFKVQSRRGPLFCKTYTHDQLHDALFHADIIEKLASEGILVPPVIRTRDNKTIGEINGLPFIVQRFFPGDLLANIPLTQKIIRELGQTLAQIHNSLEGRKVIGNTFKVSSWDPRQYDLLFSRYNASRSKFSPRVKNQLDTLQMKTEALSPNLRELPMGIIHCDYHPGNILVAHNTIAGILDFNEAIQSWYAGDIGIALSYLMSGDISRIECATLFIEGYKKERELSVLERAFVPLMIQLRVATRVIESKLEGCATSRSDIDLLSYFNDHLVSRQWVNTLL